MQLQRPSLLLVYEEPAHHIVYTWDSEKMKPETSGLSLILLYCLKEMKNRTGKRKKELSYNSPARPDFSKHFWLVGLVWNKTFTVETIAGIYLQFDEQI